MDPELSPEGAAVEAALAEWRRKAADILLAAAAVLNLLPVVLTMLGHGPAMGPLATAVSYSAYLVLAAAAALRRIDYRARLWAFFVTTYLATAVWNVALPRGPYAQVGLASLPVFVLVLLGARPARIAVLASAAILVAAPFLRAVPGVARTLAIDPAQAAGPPGLVWMQTAALAGYLIALMILLDRFHRFLLDALAAQWRAKAELEREAVELTAAQRKVENEMRARRRLEREIAAVGDRERRRLGHDLHDGVCQQVTAALLRCQALERRLERGGTLAGADFQALSAPLAEALDEAHHVALGLCPLEPGPEALAPALRALAQRTQQTGAVRCEFLAAGDVRVPDHAMAQHLYRIAQEAVSNAVRHAHASQIALELRARDGELFLQVEDDGAGLPPELPPGGLGLRTMAYRAQILEGELTVAAAPGGGTRVACRVPRLAEAPATPAHSGDQ